MKPKNNLGVVNVNTFSKIRVVAAERAAGSSFGFIIELTITEGKENSQHGRYELVAPLGILSVSSHSSKTKVYDVPGLKLTVFASYGLYIPENFDPGDSVLDISIYGV
jgi:hypothetical protein